MIVIDWWTSGLASEATTYMQRSIFKQLDLMYA